MTRFLRFHRCAERTAAAWASAITLAAVAGAAAPAVGQDETSNPDVIVDESVLDGAAESFAGDNGLLPAPAQKPISHIVRTDVSAISAQTPPEFIGEETFAAVPTTPIDSTSLDSSGDFRVGPRIDETNPAAGDVDADAALAGASMDAEIDAEGAPAESATEQPVAAEPAEAPADDAGEQTAARLPIDGMVRIPFPPGARAIPEEALPQIARIVEQLNADYGLRLQVLAYAAGDADESTHARGVSLARALAMRDYLSEQGIGFERLEIKALGNTAQEEPADRVDLIPVAQ